MHVFIFIMLIAFSSGDLARSFGNHVIDPRASLIPEGSPRIQQGLLNCFCSPTRTGISMKTVKFLGDSLNELNKKLKALKGTPDEEIALKIIRADAKLVIQKCFSVAGFKACMSADKYLRKNFAVPFCTFDIVTTKNVASCKMYTNGQLETVGTCPNRVIDPYETVLNSSLKSVQEGLLMFQYSPRSFAKTDPMYFISEGLERISKAIVLSGSSPSSRMSALQRLRSNGSSLMAMYERRYDLEQVLLIAPAQAKPSPLKGDTINESCMDVKILLRYVLQYRYHLQRTVLCMRGFWETLNPAIILNGALTSLRSLRKRFDCNRAWVARFVNNF